MSIHRVTLDLQIDDEALADHLSRHAGEKPPYTRDVSEWDATDILVDATDHGIIEPGESVVVSYDGEQPEPS